MKHVELTLGDYVVALFLIVIAWRGSAQVVLLAVIALLLYLVVRFYVFHLTQVKAIPETESVNDDEQVFEVDSGELVSQKIELDVDINYRPYKNHFRFYLRYDTSQSVSEYEYRIEGTDVFIRLLQDRYQDAGVPKTWDVLDGVVQETDVRARWGKEVAVLRRDGEKDMADLKKRTEWSKVSSSSWGGFKYFVLAKNMAQSDARRFLRQELERLKMGISSFTKQAAKLGLEPDDSWGLRLADGRLGTLSDDEFNKLKASAETFGIFYLEFIAGNKLIAVLQKLVD
jgi:hypothetical protein